MAKSSKTSEDATAAGLASAPTDVTSDAVSVSANPKAKKTTRTAGKKSPATKRKSSTSAKTKKAAASKKTEPAEEFTISDEAIRIRAYFIAQHRALSGLTGDSASDWLEARRQLFEEARRLA